MKKVRTAIIIMVLFLSSCSSAQITTPSQTPTIAPIPTLTLTSTNTPTQTNTPTITPTPIHPVGSLVFHEADETIAYNWFSYVPRSLNRSQPGFIWVTGLHGNISTNEYDRITEESRSQAEARMSYAEKYQYVLLVPVIPRPEIKYDYAVAIPWYVLGDFTASFLQRPDERVNSMIDQLYNDLWNDGYNVQKKVFIDGFSAGAMFAQRYALLNPDRIQALAAGQCGGALTLPESLYDSTPMNWPVGVNDFDSLVGNEFNQDKYKTVPQFIYIGDQDNTNSTLFWASDYNEVWRTYSQIVFLNNTFGNSDPIRLQNQVKYLNNLGYNNIIFKLYPGVGHQWTEEMWNDFLAFFLTHK